MTDYLIPFIQIGGTGAVVAVAVAVMGRWLWSKINTALDSYMTAYGQESAKIDARIEHLEKLAEEQARLSRTVEGIKDEFTAQAKSRDNRWEFRKEVYVDLIVATTHLIDARIDLMSCAKEYSSSHDSSLLESSLEIRKREGHAISEFTEAIKLAPLAVADSVRTVLETVRLDFHGVSIQDPAAEETLRTTITFLGSLLSAFQQAGRKELWGTPKP